MRVIESAHLMLCAAGEQNHLIWYISSWFILTDKETNILNGNLYSWRYSFLFQIEKSLWLYDLQISNYKLKPSRKPFFSLRFLGIPNLGTLCDTKRAFLTRCFDKYLKVTSLKNANLVNQLYCRNGVKTVVSNQEILEKLEVPKCV